MARLASVVGGVLLEMTRARVIADTLARDLVAEYESDPILANLAVPRLAIKEATVTLRFVVSGVEEVAPAPIDPKAVQDNWPGRFAATLSSVMLRQLEPAEAEAALLLFATPREAVRSRARVTGRLGTVTADTVKQALSGNGQAMVVASVTPVTERWNELPATTRRKLGSAAVFNQQLQEATEAALTAELNRVQELTEVRAALRSKLQVALAPGDLPPGATMHQVELTLRSEDIDLILAPERTGGA